MASSFLDLWHLGQKLAQRILAEGSVPQRWAIQIPGRHLERGGRVLVDRVGRAVTLLLPLSPRGAVLMGGTGPWSQHCLPAQLSRLQSGLLGPHCVSARPPGGMKACLSPSPSWLLFQTPIRFYGLLLQVYRRWLSGCSPGPRSVRSPDPLHTPSPWPLVTLPSSLCLLPEHGQSPGWYLCCMARGSPELLLGTADRQVS